MYKKIIFIRDRQKDGDRKISVKPATTPRIQEAIQRMNEKLEQEEMLKKRVRRMARFRKCRIYIKQKETEDS